MKDENLCPEAGCEWLLGKSAFFDGIVMHTVRLTFWFFAAIAQISEESCPHA